MKLSKIQYFVFLLVALGVLPAATCFSAVSFDVTNITVDNQVLTLKAVISGASDLKAGGFALTFPADRLSFVNAEAPDGVILQANAQGTTLTAGYMITSGGLKCLDMKFHFRMIGSPPYMVAANSAAFRDDLSGCNGSRPGLYVNAVSDAPVVWNSPDSVANLFVYIPRLSEITDISLETGGKDVLETVLAFSAWYVDPVMDVAYLVLPGVEVPVGSYPVTLQVTYGESSALAATDVVVR